ncbi:MAG: phosphoethanolamine transferase [Dysgonamonadaceae bacterium]|nr:phosphoethanolamine transferase [Dysgonamonadaceae bacterium]
MNFKIASLNWKQYGWRFILSLIILIPNLFFLCYGSIFEGASTGKIIAYIGFASVLYLFPAIFLKARAFFLVFGLFVLAAPIEIAHIFLNRAPVSSAFLLAIFETNSGEALELLGMVKLPLSAYVLLCVFYFYIAIRKIKNEYFIPFKKIRRWLSGCFAIILLAGYAILWMINYRTYRSTSMTLIKTNLHYQSSFGKTWPYSLVLQTYFWYDTKMRIKERRTLIRNFRFNARKANPVAEKEVYVLVIGETARYSNFSLNGYERETSPLLSKTPNLVSYSNMYSESNATNYSLPTFLTRASVLHYERYSIEKSLVDAFQEAGFKTYWIGNQSAIFSFVRRIAEDADGQYFNVTDFEAGSNYDEILWIPMQQFLSRNDEKVLIVLHTLGSHFRYNFRYPADFERFTPSLRGAYNTAMITKENRHLFVNAYDNSILYTDYFLATTIQKIDSLQAVSALVYLSDHGENLLDTDQRLTLHAGLLYSKYDFHIPFFVWTSDAYRRQYPEKTDAIFKNKDKKLSASHLFDSLLNMADISFPMQQINRSIASDSLREDSVRYIINTNLEVKKID